MFDREYISIGIGFLASPLAESCHPFLATWMVYSGAVHSFFVNADCEPIVSRYSLEVNVHPPILEADFD